MTKLFLKNLVLSFCVGLVVGIIYDGSNPKYRYFSKYDNYDEKMKEVTYEEYKRNSKNYSYILKKTREVNMHGVMLGGVVSLLVLVVSPLKEKKQP